MSQGNQQNTDTTDYSTQLRWPFKVIVLLVLLVLLGPTLVTFLREAITTTPNWYGYQCQFQYLFSDTFFLNNFIVSTLLVGALLCLLLLLGGKLQTVLKHLLKRVWGRYNFYFLGALLLVPLISFIEFFFPAYPPVICV